MSETTTVPGGEDDPAEKSWDHGSVPAAAEGDPIDEGGIKRSGASDDAADEGSVSVDGDQSDADEKQSGEDSAESSYSISGEGESPAPSAENHKQEGYPDSENVDGQAQVENAEEGGYGY